MERLSGLASGLDTQTLITKLMQVEAQPMQLMQTQQHDYQLRKGLWQEINTSLSALNTQINNLLNVQNFTVQKVNSTDASVATASTDNTAVKGQYDLNITTLAKAYKISGNSMGSSTNALGLSGNFTLNDGTYTSTINVVATDNLNAIMTKINSAKDNVDNTKSLNVSATIVNNTLVLSHNLTGAANKITLTDSSNIVGSTNPTEVLESLGLVNDGKGIANLLQNSADATFIVNGINVVRSTNTINDVVSGVTFNLLKEGASTSITVDQDTDKVYNTVKAFVDQYNNTLDLVNTRLSEDKVKGATSDVGMSKGLLRGDSALMGLKNNLRRMISDPISGGTFTRLSDLGIQTTSDDFGKSGKLVIDDTKLKDAINKDAKGVASLFFNDVDGNGIVSTGDTGVAVKLSGEIDQWISSKTKSINGTIVNAGLIPSRMDGIDKIIKDYDDKLSNFQKRLDMRESSLWTQFTAMETALSKMNNQASWLAGQLNSLNKQSN